MTVHDDTTTPVVSIILLNYKGAEDVIACLQSLRQISYPGYSIVIVDNASPDDSMEKIEEYLRTKSSEPLVFRSPAEAMQSQEPQGDYSLLQTGHNGGYGHGNNIGIKYALQNGADYVLVLNNDTIVAPGFLEPMVQMCEQDENIGIASGKIYFYDKPDVIWFNGGRFQPCTATIEHINFNKKDTGQKNLEASTFLSGCMWLIPREVFAKVGFINERYFMYVEDLEYCYRVLEKGYNLKVSDKSHIWHKVGASLEGRFSRFTVYHRSKNYTLFTIMHIDNIFCRISSISFYTIKYSIRILKNKKFKPLLDIYNGIANAL